MKQKSIKNIRKEFKNAGVFYTPLALAKRLRSYIEKEPENVYDPTCGAGNLLSVFADHTPKYGQELDEEQLTLIDLPMFIGRAGDTLQEDKFKDMKFECVVANPPFSVKWNPEKLREDVRFCKCPTLPPPSKADWAFMLHILYHLAENGTAVVLEFPGILYRGQKEGQVRKWFIEQNYIDRVVNIPGKTFEDTAIATCIVVLKKNRSTQNIIFEDGGKQKEVSVEEIRQNDYVLSPSTYLETEIKRETIDPEALENHARESFFERFRRELQFEKMVCQMEGISMRPFIDKIKSILSQYEAVTKEREDNNI